MRPTTDDRQIHVPFHGRSQVTVADRASRLVPAMLAYMVFAAAVGFTSAMVLGIIP